MLQGIGSERVLVLLDGQPLAGRISGVFDISRIPVTMIDRVEVVRGPQSTLYGTDAMGGVVNIITRTAPKTDGPLYGVGLLGTLGTQARTDGSQSHVFAGAMSSAMDFCGGRTTRACQGRPLRSCAQRSVGQAALGTDSGKALKPVCSISTSDSAGLPVRSTTSATTDSGAVA